MDKFLRMRLSSYPIGKSACTNNSFICRRQRGELCRIKYEEFFSSVLTNHVWYPCMQMCEDRREEITLKVYRISFLFSPQYSLADFFSNSVTIFWMTFRSIRQEKHLIMVCHCKYALLIGRRTVDCLCIDFFIAKSTVTSRLVCHHRRKNSF